MLFQSGLSLIRLALLQKKINVSIPYCKKTFIVIKLLYKLGYLNTYSIMYNKINISFKIYQDKHVLSSFILYNKATRIVSIPYNRLKNIKYKKNKLYILSTKLGICTSDVALYNRIGGVIIAEIK